MLDLEKTIVKYCFGIGSGLGKVKNMKTSWKRLRSRLCDPSIDTSVSFAAYMALDQDAKLVKKRAPGNWLAAHFEDGRRKLDKQMFRSMLIFDLDYITVEQLEFIRSREAEINQFHWFMHTTRAHCQEKPRVRLILLANRVMNAEETHAITRLLSLYLAEDPEEVIEIPDHISFRYNQTMFLPSRSKDQEFWTDENVAPILDVDEFLAGHPEWEDFSLLPYQEAEKQRGVVDPSRRMETPTEKKGLIGAWCRAYTVDEVISEFLTDIYAPGDSATETRYTYLPGSGSNGTISYDDGLFLHSNHGTDPIDGSANAWDLMRIHHFGHLDAKAPANTGVGNWPSDKAMREFAENDELVTAEMYAGMAEEWDVADDEDEDEEDFTPQPESKDTGMSVDDLLGPDSATGDDSDDGGWDAADDEPEADETPKKKKHDTSWMGNLRKKANGEVEPVVSNIILICENDPRIKEKVGFNQFTKEPVAFKRLVSKSLNLPSPVVTKADRKHGRRWEDVDDHSIRALASANAARGGYEVDFTRQNIEEAVISAAMRNSFHPVEDKFLESHAAYVASGRKIKGSIEQIPQTYLGCPDDAFHRESSKMFMIALAARTFDPGCKFDVVTIVRGDQGGRKGGFWRALAAGWFADLPNNFDAIDRMIETMNGALICEMGEMAGLKRETSEIAKDFITKTEDKRRLAYAHRVGTYKRASVLVGSSNLDDILHDPTGNRRFWIWRDIHKEGFSIDIDALIAAQPMLWGEAYDEYLNMRAEYSTGDLWLDLRTSEARAGQDALADSVRVRTVTELLSDAIQDWLDEPKPTNDVVLDESGFAADDDDTTLVVRNMICAKDALEGLKGDTVASSWRNADVRTYGAALKKLKGWTEMKKCRRHGSQQVWFYRDEDGPLWVPARQDPEVQALEIHDLLS